MAARVLVVKTTSRWQRCKGLSHQTDIRSNAAAMVAAAQLWQRSPDSILDIMLPGLRDGGLPAGAAFIFFPCEEEDSGHDYGQLSPRSLRSRPSSTDAWGMRCSIPPYIGTHHSPTSRPAAYDREFDSDLLPPPSTFTKRIESGAGLATPPPLVPRRIEASIDLYDDFGTWREDNGR